MSPTWRSETHPATPGLTLGGALRVALRAPFLVLILLSGVVAMVLVRLIEAPMYKSFRPWSSWITVFVCRAALVVLGVQVERVGTPMLAHGAYVANHSSWLDIFVLNSGVPLTFVSKAEVASWPGIGGLARLTGTVFVRRNPREADAQRAVLEQRLATGSRLLFFPEGTSTDGQRVLRFKPTLFQALTSDSLRSDARVQPVTVVYQAPKDADPRFYGWWGDMDFGSHMLTILAARGSGHVRVHWHEPIRVADFANRKVLADAAETSVRSAHPKGEVDT